MSNFSAFSPPLSDAGVRVGNELAWRRVDALAALDELAKMGYGILGGELWSIRGDHVVMGLREEDGREATVGWTSEWRTAEETWPAFVTRSIADAKRNVLSRPEIDGVAALAVPAVLSNFSFVSESEYGGVA